MGLFRSSRDPRQGGPLSPFLFILVTEDLSRLVIEKERIGLIEGCRVGNGGLSIPLLLFADNVLFFIKDSPEHVQS